MIARDYALELEPNASPERLRQIERCFHLYAANELTKAAQMIDEKFFHREIHYPLAAAQVCRDEALQHLNQT